MAFLTNEEPRLSYNKCGTTPTYITELNPDRNLRVCGSDLRGLHGGETAWVARKLFGAIMGQGVGLQGQSYAIPTMQGGVDTIKPYVDESIAFAKAHDNLRFMVTRIGCGIAGFRDEYIAPLFHEATNLTNASLPEELLDIMTKQREERELREETQ